MKGMVGELFQFSGFRAHYFLIAPGDRLVGFGPISVGAWLTPFRVSRSILSSGHPCLNGEHYTCLGWNLSS
jgi:hypothetical protein